MRTLLPAALLLLAAPAAATPPTLTLEGALEPKSAVEQAAHAAWRDLDQRWQAATRQPAPAARFPVRLRRSKELPSGRAGRSRPGLVLLRQDRDWKLDEKLLHALRHELAHQYLWNACPAGAEDRLFHEAFALATSGELGLWSQGDYLSLPRARRTLERARSLDTRGARRAIARLLVESVEPGGNLAAPLARRLRQCASGARWGEPVSPAELAQARAGGGDAFVVISRRSGEILRAEGDHRVPMPYGSTLKPFLFAAAAGRGPALAPRGVAEWVCDPLPPKMDLRTALLRSCNGYFIDWAARDPAIAGLGRYGPILVGLGLERVPADVTEAIGLRTTLTLSPLGLAQAYRHLAGTSPETLRALRDNVREGTLSGLKASARLEGLGTKTGTVRDSASSPELGWIVAVGEDRVAVMVRKGRQPRDFAGELADALESVAAKGPSAALRVGSEGRAAAAAPGGPAVVEPAPWRETRPAAEVEGLLGPGAFSLRFGGGKLAYLRPVSRGGAVCQDPASLACDPFRRALKLPACPLAASQAEGVYVFEGRGRD